MGIARIAFRRQDYEQAIGRFQAIASRKLDITLQSLTMLTHAARITKDIEAAIKYCKTYIGIFEGTNREITLLDGARDQYLTLAALELEQKNTDDALRYIQTALELVERIADEIAVKVNLTSDLFDKLTITHSRNYEVSYMSLFYDQLISPRFSKLQGNPAFDAIVQEVKAKIQTEKPE